MTDDRGRAFSFGRKLEYLQHLKFLFCAVDFDHFSVIGRFNELVAHMPGGVY